MSQEPLSCEVLEGFDGLDPIVAEWDGLVESLGTPIYMSYHWAKTWWKFYGGGHRLRLFVFRQSGRLVGVLPIYTDTILMPGLGVKVARLVGAGLPPKVFDPPIEDAVVVQAWGIVIERLLVKEGCDVLSCGHLSEKYAGLEGAREAVKAMVGKVGKVDQVATEVQTIYHLPATFDEYFAGLDGKERKTRRKKLRELEAEHPVSSEMLMDASAVGAEFEKFVEQHTSYWRTQGRPGHFFAWPKALEYNRALVREMGALGRVRFHRLIAGETVVARQYAFVMGKTIHAELPSREVGEAWDRHSLGLTSQIKFIESAIQAGIPRFDSGLGHYEYKILTGGRESPVWTLHVEGGGWLSRTRLRVWRKAGRVWNLVSRKIWYRKIMPMLPKAFQSEQSSLALRLDF